MDETIRLPHRKLKFSYEYQIVFRSIYAYSIASTSESAYIIGGGYTQEIIAEYKNDNWRQFGTLVKGRYWHGSIALGNEFMVIGGFSIDGR